MRRNWHQNNKNKKWIKEESKMEKFEVLKNLVELNTIKDKENAEIINYIENHLKKLGFKTEYKTQNLVMSIRRKS